MDSDDYELIGEGATAPAPCRSSSVRVIPLLHFRPHALVAQGIEHRCPKPFLGVLPTKAKRRKAAQGLHFRLSSFRIISHAFTPVAAQVRPKSGPELPQSKRAAMNIRRGTWARTDLDVTTVTTSSLTRPSTRLQQHHKRMALCGLSSCNAL